MEVTAREREVLVRLGRFRRLTSAHLAGFAFAGSDLRPGSREVITRRLLAGLRRRGLVDLTSRIVGGPSAGSTRPVYQLSESGRSYLRRLEPDLGTTPPLRDSASVEHALVAADVALAFVRCARHHAGHLMSEWEPDWSAAELIGSGVVPDAYFVYETESWEIGAFVEIDLGTERPVRFARKISEYLAALRRGAWRAHLPSWPIVLVVTPSAARATLLRRATEGVLRRERDAERLVRVAEFDFAALADVVGSEGPLGRIWQVAGREGLHLLIASDVAAGAGARDPSGDDPDSREHQSTPSRR